MFKRQGRKGTGRLGKPLLGGVEACRPTRRTTTPNRIRNPPSFFFSSPLPQWVQSCWERFVKLRGHPGILPESKPADRLQRSNIARPCATKDVKLKAALFERNTQRSLPLWRWIWGHLKFVCTVEHTGEAQGTSCLERGRQAPGKRRICWGRSAGLTQALFLQQVNRMRVTRE